MRRPVPTFATLPSGLKLHYRVQGQPGAPWLVLINGLMSDTTMWDGAPSANDERSEERAGGQRGALSDPGVVRDHIELRGCP